MKTKKSILKKYLGQGGPIHNDIRDILRTRTRGNDIVPKEIINKSVFPSSTTNPSVQVKTKPRITYSTNFATPGPKNLTDVVVPSQRIPSQANLKRPLPPVTRGGMIQSQTEVQKGQIPSQKDIKRDSLKRRINKMI